MAVNARALLITKKVVGFDELVDKILNEPQSAEGVLYSKALTVNRNGLKRQYIEACLLASNDLEQIATLLEMPLGVVAMYRSIFYDVEGFDRLSKMELIEVEDKGESTLKMWAMAQGLAFISWRLGYQVDISPVDGLQELFTTCMYKSKEAMFNSNSTESSKESVKYIKMSMDIARLIKAWVMDTSAAKKDIEMALAEDDTEFGGIDSLEEEMANMPEIGELPGEEVQTQFSLSDLDLENGKPSE